MPSSGSWSESCCSLFFRREVVRVSSELQSLAFVNYRLVRTPETLSRDCVNRKQEEGRIAWHVTFVTGCVTPGDAGIEMRQAERGADTRSQTRSLSKQRSVTQSGEWDAVRSGDRVTRDFFVNILRAEREHPKSAERWGVISCLVLNNRVKVFYLLWLHLFSDWNERDKMIMSRDKIENLIRLMS